MVHFVNGDVAPYEKSKASVSQPNKRVNVSVKRDFPPNCGRNAPRVNLQSVKDGGNSVNGQKCNGGGNSPQINAKSKEAVITMDRAFPDGCGRNAPLVHLQPLKDGVVSVNGESGKGCGPSSLQINANPKKETAVFATRTLPVIRTFPDHCGRNAPLFDAKSKKKAVISARRTFPDGCGRDATPISAKTVKVDVLSVTPTVSDGGQQNAQDVGVDSSEGGVSVENLKIETDNAFMEPSSVQKAFMEPTSVLKGGRSLELGSFEVTESSHQNESELLLRPSVPKNMNAREVSFHSEALEPIEAAEPLSIDTLETQLFDTMKTSSVPNSKGFLASVAQSEEKQLLSSLVPLPEDHVLPKSGESDLIEVMKNNKHAKFPPRRRISASRDVPPPCILNTPRSLVGGNSFIDLSLNAEKACGQNSGGEIVRGDTVEQMENSDEVTSANMQQEIVVFTEEIGDGAHVKSVEEAEEGRVEHVQVREPFENGVKQENLDDMSILSPQENTVSQLDPKSSSLKEKVDGVRACSTEKLSMYSGKFMRERVIVQGVMATANCPWSLGRVTCKSSNGLNQTTPVSKRTQGVQSRRMKGVHETPQLQIRESNGLTTPVSKRTKVVHETHQLQIQESNGLTLTNNRVIVQGLMASQNCVWNMGKQNTLSDFSHGSVERQGNRHEVAGLDDHRSGARRKLEKAEHKSSKKKKPSGNASYGSAHERSLVDEGDCSRHGKEDCGPFTQRSRNMGLSLVQIQESNGLTTPVSKIMQCVQRKRTKAVHETPRLQIQEYNRLTLPNNRVIIQGLMAVQNCVWNVGKQKFLSDFSHGSVERQGNRHEVAGLDDHRSGAWRKLEKAEHKSSKKKKPSGNASYGSAHERSLVDEGDCTRHGKEDCGPFTQRSRNMDLSLVPFGLHSSPDKGDVNCDVIFTEDGESFTVAETSDNMHLSLIVNSVNGKYDDNGAGTIGNEDMEIMPLVQTSRKMNLSLIPFGLHPLSSEDYAEKAVVTRKIVRETLRLFQGTYRKLLQDAESKSKVGQANGPLRVDLVAAKILKDTNKCANIGNKILGCVPGVEVGDEFHYRVELAIIGLHGPYQSGIDHLYNDGKALATSVVSSGGYDDVMDSSDVLVYSGQGGIPTKNKKAEDQKLQRGNLALKNSYDEGTPVRVIRGYKETKGDDLLDSKGKVITTYVYDGLYYVESYWQEIGSYGTQVFKFQLRRIPGQPELAIKEVKKSRKLKRREGLCVEDISEGKERRHINAINTMDDEKPPSFKYITTMIYPSWYNLTPLEGCQCTDGCSDSEKCACAMRNGGEIPYNYDGAIVEAKPLVYECGPSCKCPPSCHNRVTQHGMKFQLEIFKTESRGWGVRSLNSIPSGSFICEYTGELLEDKEAELRTGNDEYLFDIGQNYSDPINKDCEPALASHPSKTNSNFTSSVESLEDTGFTIDAAYSGSVGRFINHSCSPNCYAQNVLYDHDDKRMPHIMIFAAENIPPLQELAYHYNYELDEVRDRNGNIKKKNCYCGSEECTGRMY